MTDEEAVIKVNIKLQTLDMTSLTAIDGSRRDKSKRARLFELYCDICSKDKEMFPSGTFFSTVSNLNTKSYPCGCGGTGRLTDSQEIILTNRALSLIGNTHLTAIGSAVIKGRNRRITVECSVCSPDKELFPEGLFYSKKDHLASGSVPCGCSGKYQYNTQQNSVRINRILTNLNMSNFTLIPDNKLKGSSGKFTFSCSTCSLDEELWPSGSITSYMSDRTSYGINCGCSSRPSWTQQQYKVRIERLLAQEESSWCGWVKTKFIGKDCKFKWVCSEGHSCRTSVANYLTHNQRCSYCTKTGFDRSVDGKFYVVRWDHPTKVNDSFIKIGVTNKEKVSRRISQQKRKTRYKPTVIKVVEGDGDFIWNLEQRVKSHFKLGRKNTLYIDKFLDGYTECMNTSHLPELLSVI